MIRWEAVYIFGKYCNVKYVICWSPIVYNCICNLKLYIGGSGKCVRLRRPKRWMAGSSAPYHGRGMLHNDVMTWYDDMKMLSVLLALLCGESTDHWWISPANDRKCEALIFPLCSSLEAVEQKIIFDTLCNVTVMNRLIVTSGMGLHFYLYTFRRHSRLGYFENFLWRRPHVDPTRHGRWIWIMVVA